MTRNSLLGWKALGFRATCERTLRFEDADLRSQHPGQRCRACGGRVGARAQAARGRGGRWLHIFCSAYRGLSVCCLGSCICWNASRVFAVSSNVRDRAGPGDRCELAAPYGLASALPRPVPVPPLGTRAIWPCEPPLSSSFPPSISPREFLRSF